VKTAIRTIALPMIELIDIGTATTGIFDVIQGDDDYVLE
jgi:hypothetical protein